MIIYMSTGDGSERFGGGGSDAGPYQPDYSVTGQNAPGVNERMVAKMPSDPGITASEVIFDFTLANLGALSLILPVVYLETNNPGAIMRIMKAISGSFAP